MDLFTALGVTLLYFLIPVVVTAEWKENKRAPKSGWTLAFLVPVGAAMSNHAPLLITFVMSGIIVGWIFSTKISAKTDAKIK